MSEPQFPIEDITAAIDFVADATLRDMAKHNFVPGAAPDMSWWGVRKRASSASTAEFNTLIAQDLPLCRWDLNCGWCEEVAETAIRALTAHDARYDRHAEVLWLDAIAARAGDADLDNADHCVLVVNGRYYDAVDRAGVDDYHDLACCRSVPRDVYLVSELVREVGRMIVAKKVLDGYSWIRLRDKSGKPRGPAHVGRIWEARGTLRNVEVLGELDDTNNELLLSISEDILVTADALSRQRLPAHIEPVLERNEQLSPQWCLRVGQWRVHADASTEKQEWPPKRPQKDMA